MRSRIATGVGGVAIACLAPMAAAQTDDVSRTPSGRPDLSGTYDVGTLTPMQRPTDLGEKMSLTEEEAAAFGARATAALDRRNNIVPSVNTELSDPNRGAPPVGGDGSTGASGNVGGYNTFWIDPGSGAFQIDGQWRTSILVDPPNGRYPPRTQERIAAQRAATAARSGGARPRQNDGTAYWLEDGLDAPGPYDNMEQRGFGERCLLGFGSTAGPALAGKELYRIKGLLSLQHVIHCAGYLTSQHRHGSRFAMFLLLARVTGVAAVVNLGVLILREDRPTGDSIPVNLSKPCAGCRASPLRST